MPPKKTKKYKMPSNFTIDKNMRDYSKDPYFEKKAADAIAFIKKHGMPEDFKNKTKQ